MSGLPCADNLLLVADSYKISHHLQYPPNTTRVYSYFESRGGQFQETCFFGLQYILKRWLVGQVVTQAKIDEAAELYQLHFGSDAVFNRQGWEYILQEHNGHLPIEIKAVPEGTVLPVKNVLFTVENTDPKCYWLTNFLETLLVQAWYPMTVATNSREHKKILQAYLNATADNADGLAFKLHDFGFRGVSSVESAAIGGAAHLVNFLGTDTIAGVVLARDYYGCPIAGFSIPASEHSTMTSWTRQGEAAAMRNMLERFPTGLVACVSDSYDIWNACENLWGRELKDLVMSRGETNSTLVIRPDSGDPPTVVVRCLELLGQAFGVSINSKGYKMLPPYVRVIQGDGIGLQSLGEILHHMAANGWSADNVAFGSGGSLLQKHNRDTQKCAYKCSFAEVDGEQRDVYKDPVTDPGKKSKRGRLTLRRGDAGDWTTVTEGQGTPDSDELVVVFRDGCLVQEYTMDEVRERAKILDGNGGYMEEIPAPKLETVKSILSETPRVRTSSNRSVIPV
ncbi:uncharacterized protein MONBRDRAFT_24677 [Monosiga brevicollis MX1]|uniref:Nicotinamide phosphoribosyltransferase n=1 Tax=Monosiga brevicollis TaxID=81824 RepID=A9UX53_MONBE|nr:uncharacterized protein MONBRDRAFT_24677 [Monosiga brevicollis MX1]EDQ90156.1 predicted protein [Monosiga brevicollis MX1]|eukprot:XP_001744923.1 hypothetical protein [Monosiga brevicollis MX1]